MKNQIKNQTAHLLAETKFELAVESSHKAKLKMNCRKS